MSTEETVLTEENVVEAGPTRTLADFQAFTAETLKGTELENAEETKPDAGIAGVFVGASAQLTTELLFGHEEHLEAAIRDVIYGLTGIAVEYGLDLTKIVHEGVIEYQRRKGEADAQEAIFTAFLEELSRMAGGDVEGDQGTLEL